jgi:hypothetical protein
MGNTSFGLLARCVARLGTLMGRATPLSSGDVFFSRCSGHWLHVERVGPGEVVQIRVAEHERDTASGTTYVVPRTALILGQTTAVLLEQNAVSDGSRPIDV